MKQIISFEADAVDAEIIAGALLQTQFMMAREELRDNPFGTKQERDELTERIFALQETANKWVDALKFAAQ